MTEAERAERIRALQERRAGNPRPAVAEADSSGADADTLPLDTAAAERQARIDRLQSRRADSSDRSAKPMSDTQPLDTSAAEREARIRQLQERRGTAPAPPTGGHGETVASPWVPLHVAPGPVDGSATRAKPRKPKRSHKAEASRIAAVGAGVSLTFGLMAFMAKADLVVAQTEPTIDPAAAAQASTVAPVPASDPTPTTLAPAVSAFDVPVILTPIQVRTRVVRVNTGSSSGSRSGGGSSGGGGGAAPVATGGGGSNVQTPAPPPPAPPPPAPATSSNGSK